MDRTMRVIRAEMIGKQSTPLLGRVFVTYFEQAMRGFLGGYEESFEYACLVNDGLRVRLEIGADPVLIGDPSWPKALHAVARSWPADVTWARTPTGAVVVIGHLLVAFAENRGTKLILGFDNPRDLARFLERLYEEAATPFAHKLQGDLSQQLML